MGVNDDGNLKQHIQNGLSSTIEYLKDTAKRHTYYKFYSEIDKTDTILKQHVLYLSRGDNWNDTSDKKRFNGIDSTYTYFGLCTSYSKHESVAMWMLYGGVENKGAMINFKNKFMENICENKKNIEIGYFNDTGEFREYFILYPEQYELYLQDIIYFCDVEKENMCKVRRHNEVAYMNCNMVEEISLRKSYPWKYENECRLILRVKKNRLNEQSKYARLSWDEADRTLMTPYLSPNFDLDEYESYENSEIGSELEWDLCKRCSLK